METRYNPQGVEERWQQTWESEGLYEADPDDLHGRESLNAVRALAADACERRLGVPLTLSPLYGFKAIDMCNAGDPVCSDGDNFAAHSNYVPAGLTSQAAGFVAGRL